MLFIFALEITEHLPLNKNLMNLFIIVLEPIMFWGLKAVTSKGPI